MQRNPTRFTVVHATNGSINPKREVALCAFRVRGRLEGGAVTGNRLEALQSAYEISLAHGGGRAVVVTADKNLAEQFGPIQEH